MGNFEEFNLKLSWGDIARAVGDVVMSAVRHLPDSGYPADHSPTPETQPTQEIYTQQTLPYDDMGNWVNLTVPSVDGKDL